MKKKFKNYLAFFLAYLLGIVSYNLYALSNFENLELTSQIECSMLYNSSLLKDYFYDAYIASKQRELASCTEELELIKKE
jgi:hypothetical protein